MKLWTDELGWTDVMYAWQYIDGERGVHDSLASRRWLINLLTAPHMRSYYVFSNVRMVR